jgi:hypothetical protein
VIITPLVTIESPRPGVAAHQARRLLVEAEGDPERGVDEEVDPQDLHRCEWLAGGDVEQGGAEEGEHERDEFEQHEADVLAEVVIQFAALLDRVDDGREVVVGQDHAAGVLGDLGARSHGRADVGCLDRGRVVDAVAGHGDHVALPLEGVGEHLVLGSDPADDADAVDARQPHDGRAPLLDQQRDDGRPEQDDLHVAGELGQQAAERRRRLLHRKLVRAVTG